MSKYTARIEDLISRMTLEEKASLCSGLDFWHTKPIDRLDIPSVMMSDGPHGMRKEDATDTQVGMKRSIPATCFPPAVTCASTWNPALIKEMGAAMAEEARNQEVQTILGPGTNIKRNPKGGRNFEYYSEDPFLAGRMASAFIDGVHSKGIGTSLKHFAVNSQEFLRMTISEVTDERTIREIYLPAFEYAVKQSQPATVMCSYNRINGVYSSDNRYLLTDILRDEWGFKGIVVSDWGATNDRVQGIRAGLDLEMPSSFGFNDNLIVEAIKEGSLAEEELDNVVRRMLEYILRYHDEHTPGYQYDYHQSHLLARRIANEGAVLLKNDRNLLPLTKGEPVAVIGALAKDSRYQGSGSSLIVPTELVHFTEALDNAKQPYEYADGYTLYGDGKDEKLLAEAVGLASKHSKVVLVVGLTPTYESEGFDRSTLTIPESHIQLIDEVSKVCSDFVVLLVGGAPVEMPWADKVPAILNAYLAGECAGEAYYDLLFGDANPSGKLAETYPILGTDNLGDKYFRGGPRTVEHREGVFVGYRYFDSAKKAVRYPFGYGLSYTQFAYANLSVSANSIYDDEEVVVRFTVTNTGNRAGKEIAQLYVHDNQATVFRPEQELKGFAKVALGPGESKEVSITLDKRSFAYFNVDIEDWSVQSGTFELRVGPNSREVALSTQISVTEREPFAHVDLSAELPSYYHMEGVESIEDEEFSALLRQDIPANNPYEKGQFDLNSTVRDLQTTCFGRIFAKAALAGLRANIKNADMTTMLVMESGFMEVPVRSFVGMTSGIINHKMATGIITMANGRFFSGLGQLLSGVPNAIRMLRKANK